MVLELKDCPFCGMRPTAHHGHGDITYIGCEYCGAICSFAPMKKGSEAFEAYNKRHDPFADADR